MGYIILAIFMLFMIKISLFAKCNQCKHLTFVNKLSQSGLCPTCEQKRINEENAKQEAERIEQERLRQEEERLQKEREELEKKAQEELERNIEKSKLQKKLRIDEFNSTLDSLDKAEIKLVTEKLKKDKDIELFEIKYANITAKTNINKIKDFIVIDVETTGIRYRSERIVEVSAIKFIDFDPTDIFTTRINPNKRIPAQASDIHGITDEDVLNCPYFWQIIPSLEEFIGKLPVIGHNLSFDMGFLTHEGLLLNSIRRKYFDTLQLARKCLKRPKRKWDREFECYETDYSSDYDVHNHKLGTLCDYFKIGFDNAHSSAADSLATGYLFIHLIQLKGLTIYDEMTV